MRNVSEQKVPSLVDQVNLKEHVNQLFTVFGRIEIIFNLEAPIVGLPEYHISLKHAISTEKTYFPLKQPRAFAISGSAMHKIL